MAHFSRPRMTGRYFGCIHKMVRARMRASWHKLGLYRGQNDILFVLWHEEGLTQSELASRVLVAPATITNTLQRMQRDGWITRQSDPDDQRISRVYLTDKGREAQKPVQDAVSKLEQDIFRGFSKQEHDELTGYLDRVLDNLTTVNQHTEDGA